MSDYKAPKDMSGSIRAIPSEERKSSRHPTVRGQCMIDGKRYWISGWTRTTEMEDGTSSRWVTLSFNPLQEKKNTAPASRQEPAEDDPAW